MSHARLVVLRAYSGTEKRRVRLKRSLERDFYQNVLEFSSRRGNLCDLPHVMKHNSDKTNARRVMSFS